MAGSSFEDRVKSIRADLVTIDDRIRWAFADGFWPKAPNPDRAAVVRLPSGPSFDVELDPASGMPGGVDHVSAATFDVGVAEHRSRVAFLESVRLVRCAQVQLALCTRDLVAAHRVPAVGLPSYPTRDQVVRAVKACQMRLDVVAELYPAESDPNVRRAVRTRLYGKGARPFSVASACDRAVITLAGALDRAEPGGPSVVRAGGPLCRNCQASEAAPRCAGRCNTCHVFWHRNGRERPASAWLKSVAESRAAQARAMARGEGWGDA